MQFRIKEVNGKFIPQILKEPTPYWEDLACRGDIEGAQEIIDECIAVPIYHEYVPILNLDEKLVQSAIS